MNSSLSQFTQSIDSVVDKSRQSVQRKPDWENKETDIAIIGMACRFPGAEDYHQFWQNLVSGTDSVTEIPPDRWDWRAYWGDPHTEPNKTNSRWGGFIEDVDKFDAAFFNISPKEAELMDPQQRILLELSFACIEDAGYRPTALSGSKTGVFIGLCNYDYKELQEQYCNQIEGHLLTGTANTIVPNRLSYHFNFHGPSVSVDTACSSSLVALHQAVQAMANGECDLSLVGGINILVSPERYIPFSKLNMLSPTGRCRTFDQQADGYVRGEGAGIILLKRLDQALADGDQIYGIIKGSAVNHGGQARTLTSPNAFAQSQVIVEACQRADVSPTTITFIETHGTGTPLGDPIEINGLKRAIRQLFKAYGQEPQGSYCGLGSVKTNIGHLEAAAGIAGVIKVLLAMKHKKLPGINHFSQLNPRIKLADSPFYLVEETKDWKAKTSDTGDVWPLRAGVSSFGFGGTNAHIVLEAYVDQESKIRHASVPLGTSQDLGERPQVIALSAKNEERLRAQAARLLAYLEINTDILLTEIAYTLQAGREGMEARLALVVSSIEELVERLRQYEQKQTARDGIYQGNAKKSPLNSERLLGGRAGEAFIQIAIEDRDIDRLAQLWVFGVEIDWELLYGAGKPRRISLPTYPFARERYWLPTSEQTNPASSLQPSAFQLHPLIHRNTSNLTEQRFSSTFAGTEFFLNDHRVQGEKVLPGVAYLEMARAAGELALENGTISLLKDVVWVRPLVVKDKPIETHLGLHPIENGEIAFEISSSEGVHSQGRLVVGEADTPKPLDIAAIQARCQSTVESEDCYRRFEEQGLVYGLAFQGLVQLGYNEREALAHVRLPAAVAHKEYGLHPSMLDTALQATVGLVISQNNQGQSELYLPFALQAVSLYAELSEQGYAYMQYSPGLEQSSDGVRHDLTLKYDITLTDEHGQVCVVLQGFSTRAIVESDPTEVLYTTPVWQTKPLPESNDDPQLEPTTNSLLLVGLESKVVETITTSFDQAEVIALDPSNVTTLVQQSWRHLKAIVEDKSQTAHQILVVAADNIERHLYAPLAGLLKTARLEQSHVRGKVITISPTNAETLISCLRQEMRPDGFQEVMIRYDETGTRLIEILDEIELNDQVEIKYLRPGGVYWITGGLGGLGRIFARHLLEQGEKITIILSGRSALDDVGQQHLAELNQTGGTVIYMAADIRVKAEVERTVQTISETYGSLAGIIHSAGVIRDSLIINKIKAEIEAVLAPKVTGLLNIDAATQAEALDFMVLFSSIAGVLGNVGQADYAMANAFVDAFAHHRQALVEAGERSGRTLSINWPLWAEGGMQMDRESEKWVFKRTGLTALSTAQGIKAFEQGLAQDNYVQVLVMSGNRRKIHQSLGLDQGKSKERPPTPTPQASRADQGRLQVKVEEDLITMCVDVLKVNRADLDVELDFSEYGLDSILMMSLLNKLEGRYGLAIAPNAILDYPTITSLASYLIREGIVKKDDLGLSTIGALAHDAPEVEAGQTSPHPRSRQASLTPRRRYRLGHGTENSGSGQVAIIAQACRLPKSPSLERFWANLAIGRDLVTTIPADRWQAEAFYSSQPGQPDKTYANHGGFIDDIGYFDADYFGIIPEEAITIDPQQRIILELTQELWDRAGYRADEVDGTNTSIFIGAKDNNYVRNYYQLIPRSAVQHTIVNSISNMIAARISDFYNLTGAAQVIDTACSSSLVAVHDACQSILRGESELAIAGGIFLMVDAFNHISFSQARVLSADGKSYVFDERANGFVLGEGSGLVLLKAYEAAIQDGNQILGVILGSAANNDGKTMGLTVPNQAGQKAVIKAALQRSRISPTDIGYLEAHGTGTLLGDPIEIRAATQVYRQFTQDRQYCAVGSVKSNLGHTMMAAGITGLIKLVLSLQHQQIPATLHCETAHPRFKFEDSPFYPNTRLRDWEPKNGRRIGAISSFGFGGTNCHLIVAEGNQANQLRQPLPLTKFNRKRYWLGQEIVPKIYDDFDEEYYSTLIESLQNRELSRQSFNQMIVNS